MPTDLVSMHIFTMPDSLILELDCALELHVTEVDGVMVAIWLTDLGLPLRWWRPAEA